MEQSTKKSKWKVVVRVALESVAQLFWAGAEVYWLFWKILPGVENTQWKALITIILVIVWLLSYLFIACNIRHLFRTVSEEEAVDSHD